MNKTKRLIYNTALLTAVSLATRCISMVWQVWLVSKIGSAGIGLYTLVLSVGGLAATFAISGIRFTSTRLISEELGVGNIGSVAASVNRCCCHALLFGISALIILNQTAERIGFLWIGDARTVLSLEIISFELPFIALSSVLMGYFTSTGRVYKSAIVQVIAQAAQIAITIFFLSAVPDGDLELSCAAVSAAAVAAEIFAFIMLYLFYLGDRPQYSGGNRGASLTSRMLRISMPLAISAYARTSLSTVQQLLVPRGLRLSGSSADRALSDYGIVQGMAFPVVTFPACFLMALSELLVPELTQAQVSGDSAHITRLTSKLLERCLIFSFGIAAIMFTFSHDLGIAIFSSASAGKYIGALALLAPIMYMDMITDGCLKGLGEMLYSMGINIADSLICVFLVIVLLPQYGLFGYIIIIFVSEFLNFALSMRRLIQKVQLDISLYRCALSLICAIGAAQGLRLLFNHLGITYLSRPITVLALFGSALLYVGLLYICGCFSKNAE